LIVVFSTGPIRSLATKVENKRIEQVFGNIVNILFVFAG